MGVNISCIAPYANGRNSPSKPRLGDIPESCVALVLMYLDPTDICQLATLNRAFHGASTADFVWESKLPSNYRFLIEKLFDESEVKLGKKNIYGKLCRSITFDDGTKVRFCYSVYIWICMETDPAVSVGAYSRFFFFFFFKFFIQKINMVRKSTKGSQHSFPVFSFDLFGISK